MYNNRKMISHVEVRERSERARDVPVLISVCKMYDGGERTCVRQKWALNLKPTRDTILSHSRACIFSLLASSYILFGCRSAILASLLRANLQDDPPLDPPIRPKSDEIHMWRVWIQDVPTHVTACSFNRSFLDRFGIRFPNEHVRFQ